MPRNQEHSSYDHARRQCPPAHRKVWTPLWTGDNLLRLCWNSCRKKQDVPTLGAGGKMLQDRFALPERQRVLGEGGERLGIGMRTGNLRLEPISNEFFQRIHNKLQSLVLAFACFCPFL